MAVRYRFRGKTLKKPLPVDKPGKTEIWTVMTGTHPVNVSGLIRGKICQQTRVFSCFF